MKKKLFSLVMVFVLALTGAVFLTACSDGGKENHVTASVTFKADGWTHGYDFVSDIEIWADEHGGNYGFLGGGFFNEETLYNENPNVKPDTTYAFNVIYKKGYDPAGVTVTEKSGKAFVAEAGSAENNNEYNLCIKVTPSGGENYEFTLSRPTVLVKKVGFENISTALLNSTDGNVKDFLDCAQIYVDGNFTSVRQLSGKSLSADMSQEEFCVYARFDADAKRVKFSESFKQFITLKNDRAQVSYEKIPGTNQYAYAFKFATRNLDGNLTVKLAEDVIKAIGYRDSVMYTKFSVTTSKEEKWNSATEKYEIVTSGYEFKLKQYKIDDGEFTAVNADSLNKLNKEYGKSYTFEYRIVKAFVKVDGLENSELSDALMNNTRDEKIKFTVNGKKTTTESDTDGGARVYRFTIGKNTLPVDSYTAEPEIFDEFKIGVDITTVEPYSVNTVSVTTGPEPKYIGFSQSGSKFAEGKTSEGHYVMYTVERPCITYASFAVPYKQFKVKVNLNGEDYTSKLFVMGTDYYITDAAFADSGYKIVKSYSEQKTFLLGEDENAARYIYLLIDNAGGLTVYVYPGNAPITKIKIDMLDVLYQTAKVEFDSSLDGGKLTLNDKEVEDNVITTGVEYRVQAQVKTLNGANDIKFELYSGNKLIGAIYADYSIGNGMGFDLSDELAAMNFKKSDYLFGMNLLFNESGGSEHNFIAKGYISFTDNIWIEITGGSNETQDYQSYKVLIDRIVLKI